MATTLQTLITLAARRFGKDPSLLVADGDVHRRGAEADLDARPSHHETEDDHDHDDFDSFVFRFGPVTGTI